MIDPKLVTLDTFPSWDAWHAQESEADLEAWIEWHADLVAAQGVSQLTTAPRATGRKVGPNRRQTIYKVQWARGTGHSRARVLTKRADVAALVARVKNPTSTRGRRAQPLVYVRVFTGSVVWDEIEEMS